MPGGVSDSSRRWARAMADRGVEVVIVTSPGASEDDPRLTLARPQANWGLSGMAGLKRTLEEIQPDVVLVHYVPHLYQRQGASLAINHAVPGIDRDIAPVVIFAHELYYGRHEGWRHQPFGWLQRYALWPLIGRSTRVVVTVPDRLVRLRSLFPRRAERIELIPIGANLTATAGLDRAAWRESLGLMPDELALLFIGLAHPSKELTMLTCALDRLKQENIPARLLVGGGASLDHPLAKNLGFLTPEQAGDALAGADMFLVPLADGASTRRSSVMNALAAGLPIVSTFGANTDRSNFDGALRMVAAGDKFAYAEAVSALAKDPVARATLAIAGKELHDRTYAWEVLADRWLRLLEVIKRSP
jgi:glycosyltransferase involved in cell wall biosynthesis